MITYRKGGFLRLLRHTSPDPPFWAAGTAMPYSARRTSPVVVDWVNLVASASEGEDVEVAEGVDATIERSLYVHPPLLVEASGPAELIYRRGAEAVRAALAAGFPILELITSDGDLPDAPHPSLTVAIASWPSQSNGFLELVKKARAAGFNFGIVVPVIPPVTTELATLESIAAIAKTHGASFLAAVPIDVDPTARRVLAEKMNLDEESFSTLFETDLEMLTVATERHVAALAHERELADLVPVALPAGRSNWEAAAALTSTGNRMLRMNRDVELGWDILRAARTIAALGKPLQRIAAAASLAIIEPLDPLIASAVEEWLTTGTSELMEEIDRAWRLRRDHGVHGNG
ncbi:MAG TPA: hypothetical protein VM557_10740 [Thermoanaerobaculia bacterium]|nr:hypothetical protein [Thermoanaerobaculia bacterium]